MKKLDMYGEWLVMHVAQRHAIFIGQIFIALSLAGFALLYIALNGYDANGVDTILISFGMLLFIMTIILLLPKYDDNKKVPLLYTINMFLTSIVAGIIAWYMLYDVLTIFAFYAAVIGAFFSYLVIGIKVIMSEDYYKN